MTVPQVRITERPQRFGWLQIARRYHTNRWVLLGLGGAVLIIGAAFNWSWLVAARLAPILVSLAPCAIMCGVGLCGMKMMGGSCEKQSVPGTDVKSAAASSVPAADGTTGGPLSASTRHQGPLEIQSQARQLQATNERSDSHA